jgi:hypothetical protein
VYVCVCVCVVWMALSCCCGLSCSYAMNLYIVVKCDVIEITVVMMLLRHQSPIDCGATAI